RAVADQAGGADQDLGGGVAQGVGGPLGGGVRVGESGGAGAGGGAAGVEQYGADPAALGDLLGPEHRGGLDPVAGEDGGGGAGRPVVDDDGDVPGAVGLDAGCDAGGTETAGCGDAHGRAFQAWREAREEIGGRAGQGATAAAGRPAVSGRPSAMLALCTAPPAVPLARLSSAAQATIRPAASSTVTWTRAVLAPRVMPVVGQAPSGSRCTKGSASNRRR